MPIKDKSIYPANWSTEIRPAILERAKHCCEVCKVPNKAIICRGDYEDIEVYQDDDGKIFRTDNGEYVTTDYVGSVWQKRKEILITVVLTIAHLDHDTTNNDYSNLKAMCQLHHLRHDSEHHKKNARVTRINKKKQIPLF